MFASRNTIVRSVLSANFRRTVVAHQQQQFNATVRSNTRSFVLLVRKGSSITTSMNTIHRKDHQDRKGFATSLSFSDFSKTGDPSLDKAQQYMEEGVEFQSNNMLPLAMSSFQKSINEHPTAGAYYNMGVCYFQLGDFQSSINSFQESLKLAPHHADVHTNIATAHIKLNGNMKEALNHLKAAANITPQDAEIQFNLAVISENTGDLDTAISAYQAAVNNGLETAQMNLRNAKTKKFAKLAKEAEFKDSKSE